MSVAITLGPGLPYGELDRVVGENAATASDLGYTSGLKLSGDLLHLRARVYHPRLKRFLSADVIDLYRYTYTLGDPVNLVDPSGLQSMSDQQLECDYDAGYCTTQGGDRIWIVAPEQVVRTGTGGADMEWSNWSAPDDPFGSGRYGPEDWDVGDGGGRAGRGDGGTGVGSVGTGSSPSPSLGRVLGTIAIGMLPEPVGQFGVSSLLNDPVTATSVLEGVVQFGASLLIGAAMTATVSTIGAVVIPAGMVIAGLAAATIGALSDRAQGNAFSWTKFGLSFATGAVGASIPALTAWSAGGKAGAAVLAGELAWGVSYTWASKTFEHGLGGTRSP